MASWKDSPTFLTNWGRTGRHGRGPARYDPGHDPGHERPDRAPAGEDSTGHAGTIATNSLSVARQTYFSPATKLAMKFAVEIGLKDSM